MTFGRLTLFRRLVVAMSIVALVAVCASVVFLYVRFQAANDAFREETLSTFAQDMQRQFASDPQLTGGLATALKTRIKELGGQFAIVTDTGRVLASSETLDQPLVPVSNQKVRYFLLPGHDKVRALFGISMQLDGTNPVHFVQIAFPREHVIFDTVLEEFVTDIAWIWIPFVCLLLLVNILVLKFALKPLSQAAEEARQIGPSSIAARLTETRMPEDVLALVSAVNEALDRLQAGFLSLEQFSSHLAHELRTPLAIIKARLALSQDAIARKVEEDFEGVERLVSQLVDRVRIGGLHFEASDRVDLGDIGQRAAAFLAPVILSKGRDIELQSPLEPVVVSGAFDFIFRALRNLIENALNHTPPGTTITVTIFRCGITVSDSGPGYPPRWLEPVAVVGKPDSGAGGLGLGLSIVKETMIAHGGDLKLTNLPEGGASATMEFPIHQKAI